MVEKAVFTGGASASSGAAEAPPTQSTSEPPQTSRKRGPEISIEDIGRNSGEGAEAPEVVTGPTRAKRKVETHVSCCRHGSEIW